VIARTSVMYYKHKGRTPGPDWTRTSAVQPEQPAKTKSPTTNQAAYSGEGPTHLWSQDYDYPAKSILNVQDEVQLRRLRTKLRLTLQITNRVGPVAHSQPSRPTRHPTLLKGDMTMIRRWSALAERATQLDPSYALSWSAVFGNATGRPT